MTPTKHTISSCLTFIVAAAMAVCHTPHAEAYDFSAINDNGKRIYYNLLSETEIEVTYQNVLSPTYTYSGELEIPSTVVYWGKRMKVTSVSDRAFFGCRTLKAVKLPETLTSIGRWAFGWCDSIAEIRIPANVATLGADAFDGCYALENIMVDGGNGSFRAIENALYSADGKTFSACLPTAEGTVEVADGTEHIAGRAFGGCTFVDSVKIASTVRSIGRDAFSFCNSLRCIHLPAAVEEIADNAMADCFWLEKIEADTANINFSSYEGELYTHDFTRLIQHPGAKPQTSLSPFTREIGKCAMLNSHGLTTVRLTEGTEAIGEAAFAGCDRLTSVVIPVGVRRIGALAFGLCGSLENVYALGTSPDEIEVGEGAFEGVSDDCTLYVPRGCSQAYREAEGWRAIGNIVETYDLLPQTISWDCSNDRRIDSETIELGATASSGLEVRYSIGATSEGVATLDGNIMKVLTPGVIFVTAYQPGDSEHLPAEPVTMAYNRPSGVEDTAMGQEIKVYGGRGEIIIDGASGEDIAEVYDINGTMVYSGHSRRIKVAGMKVYMVRIGSCNYKVAVR